MQRFAWLWRGAAAPACLLMTCLFCLASPVWANATRDVDQQNADLQWLQQRYSQPAPSDGPDPQALAPVLATLHPAVAESQSWWSRLLNWVRHRFSAKPSATPGWTQVLIDALRHTPRWAGKAILYTGLAVVGGLVLVLLWREARILWLDSRHAKRTRRDATADALAPAPRLTTVQDIDAAPLRDRPLLLMRLLVQLLVTRRMLPDERALTHGELVKRAGFADAGQRARFAQVVRLAEARQFAADSLFGRLHPDSTIDALLEDGRALYRQLAERS
ncbi:MAG TPA: hypothetical protein VHZ99_08520 [Steroidobacteraceae bacterium]|jgi:hypothetical protein|nr:hypothetical protein [Steroidobacteraceae bacterium]